MLSFGRPLGPHQSFACDQIVSQEQWKHHQRHLHFHSKDCNQKQVSKQSTRRQVTFAFDTIFFTRQLIEVDFFGKLLADEMRNFSMCSRNQPNNCSLYIYMGVHWIQKRWTLTSWTPCIKTSWLIPILICPISCLPSQCSGLPFLAYP